MAEKNPRTETVAATRRRSQPGDRLTPVRSAIYMGWPRGGVSVLAAGRSSVLLRHRHLCPTPSPLFAEMAPGNQRRVGGGETPPATAIPWFRPMGIGKHYHHARSHQALSVGLEIPRVHLSLMEEMLISVVLSVLTFYWVSVSVGHLCITVQSATPPPCHEVCVTVPGDLWVLPAQQEPLLAPAVPTLLGWEHCQRSSD